MACEEAIGWVLSSVDERHCESEGMRVILDAVHETSFAGIDFQYAFAFVTRKKRFHNIAFSTRDPGRLSKSDLPGHIA